jgi:tetratricopeptide (TPR) repeat protein
LLIEQSPKSTEAREALFRIQLERKDYAAARATAEAVGAAHPEQALGEFLTGLVDRAEGKTEAAVRAFEKALRLQPDALEPLSELVTIELREQRADAALARLDALIKTQPRNSFAHNLRGEVLMARKQVNAALGEFALAIELAPGWWVPYRGLGLATVAGGRPEEAIGVFERGLAASDAAVPLATDLAELHVMLGNPERAIALYEKLLKDSPGNDLVANNLAMLLVTHRSDAKSLEEARLLADRFATSEVAAFLNTNGWVNFKLGRFDAAIPALERAAKLAPDAPEMRYQLAVAQYKAGQRDAARKNLEAALKPGLSFAGEADARATLAELRRS